jgi:hypothetical protein
VADYSSIDPVISRWGKKHSLSLCTSMAGGGEIRTVHVSSVAGECFQVSIAPPVKGRVALRARRIEGSRDPAPERDWSVPVGELGAGLEEVFQTVLAWMKPSERFYHVERRPIWFWLCIIYLVATVTYNLVTQWATLTYDLIHGLGVVVNLGCKILAIGFLIFRRAEGVYLLMLAFLVGLSVTIWELWTYEYWGMLPPPKQFELVWGFVLSLAVILYMNALIKRGVLKRHRSS